MLTLRPYQKDSIDGVRAEIRKQLDQDLDPSVILESPTGSGKTVMASAMAQSAVDKGGSVAFVVHRRELIDQTALTFDAAGLGYGYIASGHDRKSSPVQICSVGTLVRRVQGIQAPSLVIWDECHHVGAATWSEIRDEWSSATHVGLSATPARLDGKGLGRWFNALVPGPAVSDLMAEGNLSTYDAYAPVIPNMKGIAKRGGDYQKGQLESSLDNGEILGGIVEHWTKLAAGKKTIGFAISVNHSKHIVEAFRAAGISAAHLDAKSSKGERRRMLRDYARGEIDVLWNVDLFGEGFDLAANSGLPVTIEAVILARPTASVGLHLQQVGRALRPKDDPAIILDHAGNLLRHGLPDDPRSWTLADAEIKQSDTSPKSCKQCFAVVARHLRECPQCGYVFPAPEERKIIEAEGVLQKIVSGAETAAQLQMELKQRRAEVATASYDKLLEIQASRGLPEGWAETIHRARKERKSSPGRRL